MKVTSVGLIASETNTCYLSFQDPRSLNPFQVKGIDGLDAEEILRRFNGESGGSGTKYYDLSLKQRDVVILMGLNPQFSDGESYSSLRDRLYRLIAASRTGELTIAFFNGEEAVAYLTGAIAKLEAPKFSVTQEAKLTINCTYPMLQSPERVSIYVGAGALLVDPEDTIIDDDHSTAPHGFRFTARVTDNTERLVIQDETEDWAFIVKPSSGFKTNDHIYYSSEYGSKMIYLVRGADTLYLADVIQANSTWPIMFPGVNHIKTTAPIVWESIDYYRTYWGV